MQCPCSFNICYFNSPTPAARRRRSLDLKTILQQTFTDTGFCWSIVWERKGDGPSCKYHVSLFHKDIGPKYGVPSKSDTVLDEDIDVISSTCFFLKVEVFEVLKFCRCKLQVEERQEGEKRPEGNSGRTRLTRGQGQAAKGRWVPFLELVPEIWRENPVECWSFIQLSCRLYRFQVVQGFSHKPQSVGFVKDEKHARGWYIVTQVINLPKFHRQSCQNKPFKILVGWWSPAVHTDYL